MTLAPPNGDQLWQQLAALTSTQLAAVQTWLRRDEAAKKAQERVQATTDDHEQVVASLVSLCASDKQPISWSSKRAKRQFVQVFLEVLQQCVDELSHHESMAAATNAPDAVSVPAPTPALAPPLPPAESIVLQSTPPPAPPPPPPPTATKTTPAFGSFQLTNEEFPSLGHGSVTGKIKAPAKPKRRITTTLLQSQPSAAPVPFGSSVVAPQMVETLEREEDEPGRLEKLLTGTIFNKHRSPVPESATATATSSLPHELPCGFGDPSVSSSTTSMRNAAPPVVAHPAPRAAAASWSSPSRAKSSRSAMPPPTLPKSKPKMRIVVDPVMPSTEANSATEPMVRLKPTATNVQAAKLFAFLINERLVPSTCAALQLVFTLVFLDFSSSNLSSATTMAWPRNKVGDRVIQTTEFLFVDSRLQFAGLVLVEIQELLSLLDSKLLRVIVSTLKSSPFMNARRYNLQVDTAHVKALVRRLHQVVEEREETRIEVSSRLGFSVPCEQLDPLTDCHGVGRFALPFCETTDSRNHYRGPNEMTMFSNREKSRDGFLSLVRQFQQQQNTLVGIEHPAFRKQMASQMQSLLDQVLAVNRLWFARFFVLELVQIGSIPFAESDSDIVDRITNRPRRGSTSSESSSTSEWMMSGSTQSGTVASASAKNPDRLRKLHRRFVNAPKRLDSFGASGSATIIGTVPMTPRSSQNSQNHGPQRTLAPIPMRPAGSTTAPGNAIAQTVPYDDDLIRVLFNENQLFFVDFLTFCNQDEFCRLVYWELQSQLVHVVTPDGSDASCCDGLDHQHEDPRKNFVEQVLKLKVLARFLGFLEFRPLWKSFVSLLEANPTNVALLAAQEEAVVRMERTRVAFDVKNHIVQSVARRDLVKCIPWIVDYLSMLCTNKIVGGVRYYRETFTILQHLCHSRWIRSVEKSTGLHVALQVERLFQLVPIKIPDDDEVDDWSWDLPNNEPMCPGLDDAEFLCGEVYMQSCVSEMEDLRSFVQIRAKSCLHSFGAAISSRTSSLRTENSMVRKVRPLTLSTSASSSPTKSPPGSPTSSASMTLTRADSKAVAAGLASALDQSYLKQNPQVRKIVDFVVDAVVTNVSEHVKQTVVFPRADQFLLACLVSPSSPEKAATNVTDEDAFDVDLMLHRPDAKEAIQDVCTTSIQVAIEQCNQRIPKAIDALLPCSVKEIGGLGQVAGCVGTKHALNVMRTIVETNVRQQFRQRVRIKLQERKQQQGKTKPSSNAAKDSSDVARSLTKAFDELVEDADEGDPQLEEVQSFRLLARELTTLTGSKSRLPLATISSRLSIFVNKLASILASHFKDAAGATEEVGYMYQHVVFECMWRAAQSCLRVWHSPKELCEDQTQRAGTEFSRQMERFEALLNEYKYASNAVEAIWKCLCAR